MGAMQSLQAALGALAAADTQAVSALTSSLLLRANFAPSEPDLLLPGAGSGLVTREGIQFALARFARAECTLDVCFLIASLLSASASTTLSALNPFLASSADPDPGNDVQVRHTSTCVSAREV
jgi:hypothetical protein